MGNTDSTLYPGSESQAFGLNVLASGLSEVLGVEVIIADGTQREDYRMKALPLLTMDDVFNVTYSQITQKELKSEDTFPICVKTLTGSTIFLEVADHYSIATVKADIEIREGIPSNKMRLTFRGKTLEDEKQVKSAGLSHGSTIFVMLNLHESGKPKVVLPKEDLAKEFNYDFTRLQDDGTKYFRGGYEYHRPYGWYRFALNVLGNSKYGEDVSWLGPRGGSRTDSAKGEWPISYHGTEQGFSKKVSRVKMGRQKHNGLGVLCTPSLQAAADFAVQFEHKGQKYKIVFQNRVNPESGHFDVLKANQEFHSETPQADFWNSPQQNPAKNIYDTRPYGVLISRVN